MTRASIRLFLLLPFVVSVSALSAAPVSGETFTEEEAVERALTCCSLTEFWRAKSDAVNGHAKSIGAWDNPSLSYERESVDTSEDTIALEQSIPLSGDRSLRARAEREKTKATDQEFAVAKQNATAHVRTLFYKIVAQERRIQKRGQWLENAKNFEVLIAQRVKAGDSSPYELERLRKQLADIESDLEVDRATHENLRARFKGMLRLDDGFELSGELLPEPNAKVSTSSSNHPALAALNARKSVLQLQERAAKRWWLPNPTLKAGLKIADGSDIGYVLGIGFALPFFDRAVGEREGLRAQQIENEYQYARASEVLTAEVNGLAAESNALRQSAEKYATQGVARAGKILRIAQVAFQSGEVGILELIDAFDGVVHSELHYIALAERARLTDVELKKRLFAEEH